MIKVCTESKLIHYTHVLKTLNVFAQINFAETEKSGVFAAITDRFRTGGTQLQEVFELFTFILKIQGAARVKNKDFCELAMQIILVMFSSQKDSDPSHE